MQLVHSTFDDNNLVPFHLKCRGIVLKREKIYKYFVHDWEWEGLIVFQAT